MKSVKPVTPFLARSMKPGIMIFFLIAGCSESKSPDYVSRSSPAKNETTAVPGLNAAVAADLSGLPTCDAGKVGTLGYVENAKDMYRCTSAGWEQLNFRGETGKAGPAGTAGPAGIAGPAGTAAASLNLLTRSSLELASDKCRYGGTLVKSGLDRDSNSSLDEQEVTSSIYLCDSTIENVARSTYEKSVHSVALILVEVEVPNCDTDDPNDKMMTPISGGTGWLADANIVATNMHVVQPLPQIIVDSEFECVSILPEDPEISDQSSFNRQPALQAKLLRNLLGRGQKAIVSNDVVEEDDMDDTDEESIEYAKMQYKVYFPKQELTADEILRRGLTSSLAFAPSSDDFDMFVANKADFSPSSGESPADIAFLNLHSTGGRKPLRVSATKSTDSSPKVLRAPEEIFHIGYDLAVGPRLARATVVQISRCSEMLSSLDPFFSDCEFQLMSGGDRRVITFHGYGDHGGSGSPIFDRFGEVTGILTWGTDASSMADAVVGQNAETIQEFLAKPRKWETLN
jgi:hypothetical protein